MPLECVQHLVIMEFPGELEKFRCLVGFLGRRIPDCLVALPHLWLVVLRNLPRHVVNQGASVNFGDVLKHTFVKALLDDLPDSRLWEGAGVDLLHLRLSSYSPLDECRLQSDLDEAVV